LSERAYSLIDEVYKEIFPYIEEEISKELVDFPVFRAVRAIRVGPRSITGYTDVEKKTITISAEDVDKLFEMGYTKPFIKYVLTSAFFHELRHYKDLMKMTPVEREEFKKKYAENPEYHAEFEERATEYGRRKAEEIEEIRLRRELEKLTEELRRIKGETTPTSSEQTSPNIGYEKRLKGLEEPPLKRAKVDHILPTEELQEIFQKIGKLLEMQCTI